MAAPAGPAPAKPSHAYGSIGIKDILGERKDERKTKIVCTVGPAVDNPEKLVKLIDAGMNVARLNFSHGDHKSHGKMVANLRAALLERPEARVALMLDTKGPEIRTGFLEEKTVEYEAGQSLELVTDYSIKGNKERLAVSYKALPSTVKIGSEILCADGSLILKVTEIKEASVVVKVVNTATIGERKNMNLPGLIVDLPTVTEKDIHDITEFAVTVGVDMIAASFVRKGSDIDTIRDLMPFPHNKAIKIIAKIENQEGLENYDDILAKADGIMVARGDLGMEIPPAKVFLAQKMMIRKCNLAGKPVITATQMLESMIKSPRPTRAECTDVANAVLDGTDCVMLSGESASGLYPIAAVQIMSEICKEAEGILNYKSLYDSIRQETLDLGLMSTTEAVASSAVKTAIDMGATVILVVSQTGGSARQIAKYKPSQPIWVVTDQPSTERNIAGLTRGCTTYMSATLIGTDRIIESAVDRMKKMHVVNEGDLIVAVHGQVEDTPGSTNLLKVLTVA